MQRSILHLPGLAGDALERGFAEQLEGSRRRSPAARSRMYERQTRAESVSYGERRRVLASASHQPNIYPSATQTYCSARCFCCNGLGAGQTGDPLSGVGFDGKPCGNFLARWVCRCHRDPRCAAIIALLPEAPDVQVDVI